VGCLSSNKFRSTSGKGEHPRYLSYITPPPLRLVFQSPALASPSTASSTPLRFPYGTKKGTSGIKPYRFVDTVRYQIDQPVSCLCPPARRGRSLSVRSLFKSISCCTRSSIPSRSDCLRCHQRLARLPAHHPTRPIGSDMDRSHLIHHSPHHHPAAQMRGVSTSQQCRIA
jgi:hypothetical protein